MKPREIPREALFAASLNCDLSVSAYLSGRRGNRSCQNKNQNPLKIQISILFYKFKTRQHKLMQHFPVVQWMGVCLPVQGHGLNLWFRKTPHAIRQLSLRLRATLTEPIAATTEACVSRACLSPQEKPLP